MERLSGLPEGNYLSPSLDQPRKPSLQEVAETEKIASDAAQEICSSLSFPSLKRKEL